MPPFFTGELPMLKKINPNEVFKTVSMLDSAIDKENSDMEAFEEDHKMEHLKFKEGEEPTIFNISNILTTVQSEIQEEHYKVELPSITKDMSEEQVKNLKPQIKQVKQNEMLMKYFKMGVKTFEEGGKEYPANPDIFPFAVVQELGSFVMLRTALGENEKK